MNTTVKWLAVSETFHPEICTSPLLNSRSPYWVIDDIPLVNVSERQSYGARIVYHSDTHGRNQAELFIMSVNETLDGSNVSCIVAAELRRVYILRIIPLSKHTCVHMSISDIVHVEISKCLKCKHHKEL